MKFITRNSSHSTLQIGYKEKYAEERVNTKFLGLHIDNHINWKNNKEKMIPKLSEACYVIRSKVCISNINTLKLIYYVYFHSIIKYGVTLWGVTLPTMGKFSLYKRKLLQLWLVHKPEPPVEVHLNN